MVPEVHQHSHVTAVSHTEDSASQQSSDRVSDMAQWVELGREEPTPEHDLLLATTCCPDTAESKVPHVYFTSLHLPAFV